MVIPVDINMFRLVWVTNRRRYLYVAIKIAGNYDKRSKALTPEGVRSLVLQSALSKNPNFFRLRNRLATLADVELPVDILQVSFDGCW